MRDHKNSIVEVMHRLDSRLKMNQAAEMPPPLYSEDSSFSITDLGQDRSDASPKAGKGSLLYSIGNRSPAKGLFFGSDYQESDFSSPKKRSVFNREF